MKSNQSSSAQYYQLIIQLIQLESMFDSNDELMHYYQSNLIPEGY